MFAELDEVSDLLIKSANTQKMREDSLLKSARKPRNMKHTLNRILESRKETESLRKNMEAVNHLFRTAKREGLADIIGLEHIIATRRIEYTNMEVRSHFILRTSILSY